MNVLSLFTGIGGLDLGVKLAVPTAKTILYVEANGYCQRVLAARMADGRLDPAPIHGDITRFDGRPWRGSVDCVAGGWPCQPVSVAGKRRGREDARWLWPELARVLREVRPRLFFGENVPGLLALGMGDVLRDLASLGLDAEWGMFSAADAGAPHLRKRVFLLAHACCERGERWREPGDVEGESGSAEGEARQRQRGRDATDDCRTGVLADAGCAERWPEAVARSSGSEGSDGEGQASGAAGLGGRVMAHGISDGLEGQQPAGSAAGTTGRGSRAVVADTARHLWRAFGDGERDTPDGTGYHRFPPGPGDRDGWRAYLEAFPDAQPSVEGKLNPVFVELLMGLPPDWTRINEIRRPRKAVRAVWTHDEAKADDRPPGGIVPFQETPLLQPVLQRACPPQGSAVQGCFQEASEEVSGGSVRGVRYDGEAVPPSSGPKLVKQRSGEPSDPLLLVSHLLASCCRGDQSEAREAALSVLRSGRFQVGRLRNLPEEVLSRWLAATEDQQAEWLVAAAIASARLSGRVDRLRALGNAVVPQQAALAWRQLWERLSE